MQSTLGSLQQRLAPVLAVVARAGRHAVVRAVDVLQRVRSLLARFPWLWVVRGWLLVEAAFYIAFRLHLNASQVSAGEGEVWTVVFRGGLCGI